MPLFLYEIFLSKVGESASAEKPRSLLAPTETLVHEHTHVAVMALKTKSLLAGITKIHREKGA